jgi:hypothetical protein
MTPRIVPDTDCQPAFAAVICKAVKPFFSEGEMTWAQHLECEANNPGQGLFIMPLLPWSAFSVFAAAR